MPSAPESRPAAHRVLCDAPSAGGGAHCPLCAPPAALAAQMRAGDGLSATGPPGDGFHVSTAGDTATSTCRWGHGPITFAVARGSGALRPGTPPSPDPPSPSARASP